MRRILIALSVAALAAAPALASDANGVPVKAPGNPPGTHIQVPAVAGSLTTMFASNNSFAGNTFDLVPAVNLTWTGTDFNLDPAGNVVTMEVYTRTGTANGFQSTAAGWTSLGTQQVTSAGNNVATPSTLGNGVALTATTTTGVYVYMPSYAGTTTVMYTNGGPTTFSNAELSLTTYYGIGTPAFGTQVFYPRQWNGTIHYDFGVPVELMRLSVE